MLGNRLVDPILIVGAVSREGCDRVSNLVEQLIRQRRVIDLFLGEFDRDDLAALSIDADVQLAPGSAARGAVLFDQPLPGSAKFHAGAVDQEMQRPNPAPAQWQDTQCFAPTTQCRVIRHAEIEAEQSDDRADEPLGLPQCQMEDRAHRQRRRDRQGRIMRLAARRGSGFCSPRRDRLLREPND
jgi:hypothetical protein